MPRPRKPPTEKVSFRLPVAELPAWHEAAVAEGRDLSDLIRDTVRQHVRKVLGPRPEVPIRKR